MTDQVKLLLKEAASYHAAFHQFLLAQQRSAKNCHFLFFEGVDDPAFYISRVLPFLQGRDYVEFVCNGRDNVLGVHRLCARDGRAGDRCLYFVDKDLTDILDPAAVVAPQVFQTGVYSFENYLVCDVVLRRFWVERMRLEVTDPRYEDYRAKFDLLHKSFSRRMCILMALVLIGHGIEGRTPLKLNLNNVNMDKVLRLDVDSGMVHWQPEAGENFLAASNMRPELRHIRSADIRRVFRKFLRGRPTKGFIRGKYELWFLVKYLAIMSRKFSDKAAARAGGYKRAAIGDIISSGNCLDSLPSLAPCPDELASFLSGRITTLVGG